MMDTTDTNQTETESMPFQQICPLHGTKVLRHHGCPKCVLEEVRRHEQRIHVPLEQEAPMPPDSIGSINPLSIEIS